jgi:hypothetical protein
MGNYNSYIFDVKKVLSQIDIDIEGKSIKKNNILDERILLNNEILKSKFKTVFMNITEHKKNNNNLEKEFIKQKNYNIISYINLKSNNLSE